MKIFHLLFIIITTFILVCACVTEKETQEEIQPTPNIEESRLVVIEPEIESLISINEHILLIEDFKDNRNNWFVGEGSDYSIIIKDGKYNYSYETEGVSQYIYNPYLYEIDQQSNFIIETTIHRIEGSEQSAYGLCWGGDGYYYNLAVFIYGNGLITVGKVEEGIWYSYLDEYECTDINQGNSKNTLTIKKMENTYEIFINGYLNIVFEFESFWGDDIGFVVLDKQKIVVESLYISQFDFSLSGKEQITIDFEQLTNNLTDTPIKLNVLSGHESLFDYTYLADKYLLNADSLRQNEQYQNAAEMYLNAALAENQKAEPNLFTIAHAYNEAGYLYDAVGDFEQANYYLVQALDLNRELDDKQGIATALNNIGLVHYSQADYQQALRYYQEALNIAEALQDKESIAIYTNNMGLLYQAWGQYDKAITCFTRALEIDQELGREDKLGIRYNNLGLVYYAWGDYDRAIYYYQKALAITEEYKQKHESVHTLNNLGLTYYKTGQYKEAKKYLQLSLDLGRELNKVDNISFSLNHLGMVSDALDEDEEAIDYYEQALEIAVTHGMNDMVMRLYNNIAFVYFFAGYFEQAIEIYKQAIDMAAQLQMIYEQAVALQNLGMIYWYKEEYNQAADYFLESIGIKEELRLTASGSVRRDFLASQIETYEWLISTYIKNNQPEQALAIAELSRTKYLVEQMSSSLDTDSFTFSGLENFRKKMDQDTVVISYSSISSQYGIQIAFDKENIYSKELETQDFIQDVYPKYNSNIEKNYTNLRGIRVKRRDELDLDRWDEEYLEKIINYYRSLISRPLLNDSEQKEFTEISHKIYNFLMGDIKTVINDKKTIIIIPDGILGFLPFETLIMPDGRYLVQEFDIKYTQSLTVSELIEQRKYSSNRKTLLAFGGAQYRKLNLDTEQVTTQRGMDNFIQITTELLYSGENTRKAYAELGIMFWDDLPGTLNEVEAIQKVAPLSEIITGSDVNEQKVKQLSESTDLKQYKVIHFATHGLVVPELPELSAIVLSMDNEQQEEDSYLNMLEIAHLNIAADFVNLSACETGLGKIYGGEGVVGLTQSFLIAGANALSVSLWQVADESTAKFMIGLYKYVYEQNMSYVRAINQMKRSFIRGAVSTQPLTNPNKLTVAQTGETKPNLYSQPFFWAPFVYYGK